jgi:hypothetical protein
VAVGGVLPGDGVVNEAVGGPGAFARERRRAFALVFGQR